MSDRGAELAAGVFGEGKVGRIIVPVTHQYSQYRYWIYLWAFAIVGTCLSSGCLSAKYRLAAKNVPSARSLGVSFPSSTLGGTLDTVIVYGGPGSWKRQAFWDEYVVTLHNPGPKPLTIISTTLVDCQGGPHGDFDDPWKLERESKTLERKFADAGIAFTRNAVPAALFVGAEMASAYGGLAAGAGTGAGLNAVGSTVLVAVPIYYIVVISINHHNKNAVVAEFSRRRLSLPLVLAPGELRTGSFFFPMVPNPRSLTLCSAAPVSEYILPLDFLHGLHVKAPSPAQTNIPLVKPPTPAGRAVN